MSNLEQFHIRTLQTKDYDLGIIELLGQLTSISKDAITKQQFIDYVDALDKNNRHITIVIEDLKNPSAVIGTATLIVEPKLIHNLSFVGHIEDVVVDQSYRGYGLGKMLVEHLSDKAELLDCYKVILDCDKKNVSFYEKCGFTCKGAAMALYFNSK